MSLDKDQVRDYVVKAGEKQKEEIKADVSKSFVYLKFDCATRQRVNYLGLNARYVANFKPMTKTLAVIDTKSDHTSNRIRKMILESLEIYDIPITNVLVGVTDNATNMVRCMADLKSMHQAELHGDDESSNNEEEFGEGTVEMSHIIPVGMEHQRCAAHTLQLAIKDGLEKSRALSVVAAARTVVKGGIIGHIFINNLVFIDKHTCYF